jgi:excisionase family DNA binding protein
MHDSFLFSKKVAAGLLSISVRKLEQLISAREIPVRRVGRRVLITREALVNFAHRTQPTNAVHRAAGVSG